MSRNLTGAMLTALLGSTVRPVFFYEGEFSGGTLRLWSGAGDTSWNGETWTGAGNLLTLSPVQEGTRLGAFSFSVSLSGQFASLIQIALAQCQQGLPGRVWIGAYDENEVLIADPYKAFEGRLDVSHITDNAADTTIAIQYESRLIDMKVAKKRRYTPEDQRIDYPTDLGFEGVAKLQDKSIVWGKR